MTNINLLASQHQAYAFVDELPARRTGEHYLYVRLFPNSPWIQTSSSIFTMWVVENPTFAYPFTLFLHYFIFSIHFSDKTIAMKDVSETAQQTVI